MSSQAKFNLFVVIALIFVALSSVFFVDEREKVLLLRLGQIERAD
jgi:membrane protease subunit HflC